MIDFSAKTQNEKRNIDHVLMCIYEVQNHFQLVCSMQNEAQKYN